MGSRPSPISPSTFPKGVIYGLIGPNGSGKTTIFNLFTGIYTPTQGKILFQGEDIVGKKPYKIVHKGIARTFQNLRIFGNLSVMDNIRVARHFTTKAGLFASFLRLPQLHAGRPEQVPGRGHGAHQADAPGEAGQRDRPRTCPTANCAAWRSPAPWPPSPSSSSWTSPRPA